MKRLPKNARAVVTGGGSGLGRALCQELAGRGARVLITDINADTAAETAQLLQRAGAEAHTMTVDVRHPQQVEAMEARATELWGGTDVLVNNAGLAVVGELGQIPVEEWQFQVDVNLMGVIWGCHYFGPKMAERGNGYILNVASSAGLLAAPMMGPYNVTKAGVVSLSETLFAELGRRILQPYWVEYRSSAPEGREHRVVEALQADRHAPEAGRREASCGCIVYVLRVRLE